MKTIDRLMYNEIVRDYFDNKISKDAEANATLEANSNGWLCLVTNYNDLRATSTPKQTIKSAYAYLIREIMNIEADIDDIKENGLGEITVDDNVLKEVHKYLSDNGIKSSIEYTKFEYAFVEVNVLGVMVELSELELKELHLKARKEKCDEAERILNELEKIENEL